MRTINEIVIHHAAATQHDITKILPSFDRTHKERLTDPPSINQPLGGGDYPNIAYHYIITPTEETRVRSLAVEGYHASNYQVNLQSIAICLSGNLDTENPTESQLRMLEARILKLKKEFPEIKKVSGHRHYSNKTCPGLNFPEAEIKRLDGLIRGEEEPKYTPKNWQDEFIDIMQGAGVETPPETKITEITLVQMVGIVVKICRFLIGRI